MALIAFILITILLQTLTAKRVLMLSQGLELLFLTVIIIKVIGV